MIAVLQRVSEGARTGCSKSWWVRSTLACWCCCVPSMPIRRRWPIRMLAKMLKLRIFGGADGKMNHSLQDMDGQGTAGGLLPVKPIYPGC